jgi:hypothetical protein
MFRYGHAGVPSVACTLRYRSTLVVSPAAPALTPAPSAEPALEPWPIGAVVSAHWLARRWGPEPDGPPAFEVARLGLIDLSAHSRLTARGAEASRQRGWR